MDTGEYARIAPVDLVRSRSGGDAAAHDLAFGFELEQRRLNREAEGFGQMRSSHRTDGVHPATNDGERFVFQVQALGCDPKSSDLLGAAGGNEFGKEGLPVL